MNRCFAGLFRLRFPFSEGQSFDEDQVALGLGSLRPAATRSRRSEALQEPHSFDEVSEGHGARADDDRRGDYVGCGVDHLHRPDPELAT